MYVLDGGLGLLLEKYAPIKKSVLWSGQVCIDNPEIVEHVYKQFINAGSEVITTATYQMAGAACHEMGVGWDEVVAVATRALAEAGANVKIAGSVGPYGCYINDGSEFTGIYGEISVQKLVDHHTPLAKYLESHPDIDYIAFETIPNLTELEAILALDIQKPHYISLRSNSSLDLSKCVEKILKNKNQYLFSVGVNCVDFHSVDENLSILKLANLPLVASPNYGMSEEVILESGDRSAWETCVRKWIKSYDMWGIGGCCGTSPEEIRIVRQCRDSS